MIVTSSHVVLPCVYVDVMQMCVCVSVVLCGCLFVHVFIRIGSDLACVYAYVYRQ